MAAIRSFMTHLFEIAAEKHLWLYILGEIDGEQMWLVRSRENADHDDPKILILAGFHGDERGGPYGILQWLKTCDTTIFKKVDLSFIPIVNPIGFKKNQRYSIVGERNNQGFCHPESGDKRSREGEIIYNNVSILLSLAKNGYLSLHEDALVKEYYVYTFEKRQRAFTKTLKDTLGKHFKKPLDGLTINGISSENMIKYPGETGTPVVNGWVNHGKLHDGSLEDFLFHANIPRIAVSETPGRYKLQRRVNANVNIIDKYIELSLRAIKRELRKKTIGE